MTQVSIPIIDRLRAVEHRRLISSPINGL